MKLGIEGATSLVTIALALAVATVSARAERKPSAVTLAPSATVMADPVGSFAPMLAKVIPAVVTILVTGATPQPVEIKPRNGDGTSSGLPPVTREPFRSGGSGVIIDRARGHILTNNHVITDAIRIEVSLSDGRRMLARLIGRDVGTDIAVIEVTERELPSLPIGDSDKIRVGDVVAAVGNPYGLEGTATLGIVSALMRTDVGHGAFEDFMQIDASINPGNSGGALVNVRGELIGINTAGPSERGKGAGIGFAIPINMAKTITAELVAHGRMKRGSPGLIVEDVSHETMMAQRSRPTRGAHIVEVVANSPAASAGIKPGAIVVSVANKPVRNAAEFATRFETVPAGTTLPTVVSVDGKTQTYSLLAAEIVLAPSEIVLKPDLGAIAGVVVGDITLGNPLFGDLRGAQVLNVPKGTPLFAAGLDVGDVIVAVDGGPVWSSEDLVRLLERTGMQYRLKIVRGGIAGWVRVTTR